MKNRTPTLLRKFYFLFILLPSFLWAGQPAAQTSQPAVYVRRETSGEVFYRYRKLTGELEKIIPLLEKLSSLDSNLQLLIFVDDEVDVGTLVVLLKRLRQIKWKNVVINNLVAGTLKEEVPIDDLVDEGERR